MLFGHRIGFFHDFNGVAIGKQYFLIAVEVHLSFGFRPEMFQRRNQVPNRGRNAEEDIMLFHMPPRRRSTDDGIKQF